MVKSFREWFGERYKSEHEPYIRAVASDARMDSCKEKYPTHNRFADFGDCYDFSCKVATRLKSRYPSTRVVSNKDGEHSWVEIPEIDHYVDPSVDQFHDYAKHRKGAPSIKDRFPNNIVRVGHMKAGEYGKDPYHQPTVDSCWPHYPGVDALVKKITKRKKPNG